MRTFSPISVKKKTKEAQPDVAFNGGRLAALRALEGITQGELADALGVGQSFISGIESRKKQFPADLAQIASAKYQLPETFFQVKDSDLNMGVTTFRKAASATTRNDQRVKALFGEAERLFAIASKESRYLEANLGSFQLDDTEHAARKIRYALRLDERAPIENSVRAVEKLGVGVVVKLDDSGEATGHDGLSRPQATNTRPLIALLGEQPGDRQRMTVMHELGHLIFDQNLVGPIGGTRSREEVRAFDFAGAMLVPAIVMHEHVSESLTLHGFLPLKAQYGVSVAALVMRAHRLGLISTSRKRSLFIQMSSQGWRKHEPVPVRVEKPSLLSQALEHGISSNPRVVSEQTGVKQKFVEHWANLPVVMTRDAPSNVINLWDRKSEAENFALRM